MILASKFTTPSTKANENINAIPDLPLGPELWRGSDEATANEFRNIKIEVAREWMIGLNVSPILDEPGLQFGAVVINILPDFHWYTSLLFGDRRAIISIPTTHPPCSVMTVGGLGPAVEYGRTLSDSDTRKRRIRIRLQGRTVLPFPTPYRHLNLSAFGPHDAWYTFPWPWNLEVEFGDAHSIWRYVLWWPRFSAYLLTDRYWSRTRARSSIGMLSIYKSGYQGRSHAYSSHRPTFSTHYHD